MPQLLILVILAAIIYYFVKGRRGKPKLLDANRPRQGPTPSPSTPESHQRGDAFEDFVQHYIFRLDFDLVYRTPTYAQTQQRYDENALKPDFKFRCRSRGKQFWVEAKFRENLMNGKVEWCRWDQLQRYRQEHRHALVFVAIGLGGRPSRPERLFVVPLDALQYTGVYPSILAPYEVKANRAISSKTLWYLERK